MWFRELYVSFFFSLLSVTKPMKHLALGAAQCRKGYFCRTAFVEYNTRRRKYINNIRCRVSVNSPVHTNSPALSNADCYYIIRANTQLYLRPAILVSGKRVHANRHISVTKPAQDTHANSSYTRAIQPFSPSSHLHIYPSSRCT